MRNKVKACEECGIHSLKVELPAETSEQDIIEKVLFSSAETERGGGWGRGGSATDQERN